MKVKINELTLYSYRVCEVYVMEESKKHWEEIYQTKQPAELSWTEEIPATSVSFVHNFFLPKTARIIDVGGGDSRLVDFLLTEQFQHITVLDISGKALDRAKHRLGSNASRINWIEKDITGLESEEMFDLWHDRAAFHFLTDPREISKYAMLAKKYVKPGGYLVIGTFSENGPVNCSGLPVTRYNQHALQRVFSDGFKILNCIILDHETPFKTKQNFIYCSFQRI